MIINIFTIIQLVLSILLIIAVLLQQQGAGLGAGFGGGGGIQTTRRGPEKMLYKLTIAISILLFTTSLAIVII
ncbi:preprotein translocase subunit SecG [Patescibacteria group bacterium]|nr:preprotein translocase subunit SecG [Patescibacteria group bacterium]MBU1895607.1 preprotein translocase subunit SecG [Patescibacteria group bacterium]